ncbi:MAG: hypothetical protein Q8898_14480 [Bacillota bacterium]|nr:hypothetical protein [Bacillota bacterium]
MSIIRLMMDKSWFGMRFNVHHTGHDGQNGVGMKLNVHHTYHDWTKPYTWRSQKKIYLIKAKRF